MTFIDLNQKNLKTSIFLSYKYYRLPYELRGVNLLVFLCANAFSPTCYFFHIAQKCGPLHVCKMVVSTKLEENIIKKYEEDDYLLKLWFRVCRFGKW